MDQSQKSSSPRDIQTLLWKKNFTRGDLILNLRTFNFSLTRSSPHKSSLSWKTPLNLWSDRRPLSRILPLLSQRCCSLSLSSSVRFRMAHPRQKIRPHYHCFCIHPFLKGLNPIRLGLRLLNQPKSSPWTVGSWSEAPWTLRSHSDFGWS